MKFKGTKLTIENKALIYAKKVWGTFIDYVYEDCSETRGSITKTAYLSGYNQALEDSKAPEMLEMLKKHLHYHNAEMEGLSMPTPTDWYNLVKETEKLINEATKID